MGFAATRRNPKEEMTRTMTVAITGASGLVGSALSERLRARGDAVRALVRREPQPGTQDIRWDPKGGAVDDAALAGVDAVVHLAGENIGDRRWNAAVKQEIRDSRVLGTRNLATALARMATPPRTLVCASAVGFYGDRGAEELTEDASRGAGFLAETCEEWESAAAPARDAGVRVVHLRFGVILSSEGGALRKMRVPFSLGVGGVMGDGRQFMSWIGRQDAAGVIQHALDCDELVGPVNAVAGAVDNREFTKTLGRVLRRPTILPMPALAARAAFGEMAQELLLGSTRAVARRLQATGYQFLQPTLEEALRHELRRPATSS